MASGTAVVGGSVEGGWVFTGTVTGGRVEVAFDLSVVVLFAVVVPPLAVGGGGKVEGTSGPRVSRSRFDSSESEYRLTPF